MGQKEVERYLSIGAAVERAAVELPEGYDLEIALEKDAGVVTLYIPVFGDADEGMESRSDWGGEPFGTQINMAIDHAIEHHRTHTV